MKNSTLKHALQSMLKMFHSMQKGQTLLEYAFIFVIIVLVLIAVFPILHQPIKDVFQKYENTIESSSELWSSSGVVFQEDFSSMDQWNTTRGIFSIDENGRVYNASSGENRAFIDYEGENYTVDINVAHLTEGQGYGVWFRSTDVDSSQGVNGYTFQYDPGYGSGAFLFRKWVNGHEQSPFGRVNVGEYSWYDAHDVSLQVQGNTFTAYINGEPVISAQDDTYTSGTVGLRTWGNSQAYFDDITIEELHNP
jgi:fructan beta-fructosidase